MFAHIAVNSLFLSLDIRKVLLLVLFVVLMSFFETFLITYCSVLF